MAGLEHLFSPVRIGGIQLKNRLVMSPMAVNMADNGIPSSRQVLYYAARAEGGAGLIISESNYVEAGGRGGANRLGLHDDSVIPGHARLTGAVHKSGGVIFAQLHHGGAVVPAAALGRMPVSSSATPLMAAGDPFVGIIPRRLSVPEIKEIVGAFAEAALRARRAGYDGVQVLAGHGYLIHQFLSPRYNRRADAYGGSPENRARILLEVVAAIRRRAGSDFPLSVRLTGREFAADGYGLDFTCWLAQQLEGCADEASITGGNYEEREWMVSPPRLPGGFQAVQAAEVRKSVRGMPVSVAGRISDPVLADRIIGEGKADLVYMGRALLADPDLPAKAMTGRLDRIRPCIACNRGCLDRLMKGLDIQCAVNPVVGREGEFVQGPAPQPKSILVVGGGPAGMEAAAAAAKRGHRVKLVEREKELGGKARAAAVPPFRQRIAEFLAFQVSQLDRAGVEVKTGVEVSAETLGSFNADEVIIAAGGMALRPDIPGIGLEHVLTAEEVLAGPVPAGERVAVIGGGPVGLEAAEYLAEAGKRVAVLEMADTVGGDEETITKKMLILSLNDLGVVIHINCRVEAVVSGGVIVTGRAGRELAPADTVVLATGFRPDRSLLHKLDIERQRVQVIGDCRETGNILEAVREGFLAGWKI